MNHSFPRIITLLRKEKGLSQKSAAEQLGISQALLSHYEKGVRECGLDFVVRIADFYDVSTDYLLGRTPNRHNHPMSLALGPDVPTAQSVSPLLASRQRVIDSLVVIYDLLDRAKNRAVSQEAVTFLSCAIYRVIRQLAAHFPEPGEADLSTIAPDLARAMATAAMEMSEAHMTQSLQNSAGDQARLFPLTSRVLTERYPAHAPGLLNLMVVTEGLFASKKKEKGSDKPLACGPTAKP